MNKPYVGVTGAASKSEVENITNSFEQNSFSMQDPIIPMIGVLISYKTIDIGFNPGNRRYPSSYEVSKILESSRNKAFNTIHFNTKRPEMLSRDIGFIMNVDNIYDRKLCHGIQYNVAWPPLEEIDKIKSEYPSLKMILQLSGKAIRDIGTEEIVKKTKEYNTDYVLIDLSGGRGMPLNMKYSSFLFNRLKDSGIGATIGFAGGLSGKNAENVIKKLRNAVGNEPFSIDAEGNLRDKLSDKHGDDVMNPEKMNSYIEAAARGFS